MTRMGLWQECVCVRCLRPFYSSLEGAMKLRFSSSAPLQMNFSLESFLAKVKN